MVYETQIVRVLREYGELSVVQICRVLNGYHPRAVTVCLSCKYYLNPRRRRKQYNKEPSCRVKLPAVRRALKRLEKAGVVTKTREKRLDPRNARGWDFFHIVRLAY